jgi:hypothetical protein
VFALRVWLKSNVNAWVVVVTVLVAVARMLPGFPALSVYKRMVTVLEPVSSSSPIVMDWRLRSDELPVLKECESQSEVPPTSTTPAKPPVPSAPKLPRTTAAGELRLKAASKTIVRDLMFINKN